MDRITIVAWRHLVNDIDLSRSLKSPKKFIKTLFWRLRSFNVIEFGGNREPVWDFLLFPKPYLAPLLRYSDLLTENHKFVPPPLI